MAKFTGTLPATPGYSDASRKSILTVDATLDYLELAVDSIYNEAVVKGSSGVWTGKSEASKLATLKKMQELGVFDAAAQAGLISGSGSAIVPGGSIERRPFEDINWTEMIAAVAVGAVGGYMLKTYMKKA